MSEFESKNKDVNDTILVNHFPTFHLHLSLEGRNNEKIHIYKNGKELTFTVSDLWQTLEKYHECQGCDFW